ncbi:L-alanine-DL-glutamate epimerase-like enolase superfamily enzyme [Mycolicibacterium moriokaense]|uniref:L-alanine-DL-glutamate epimerase-like enolase superfamily enzyme n=1 Tax=Mycolicibacterium moriokaense TaxID=39691 RepID=A0A318GZV2_9MYCO|nr:L-alanine-DL-glutamate epimerase-like enolase superfamily enzyme [Mycolicibacterium moriokaense]
MKVTSSVLRTVKLPAARHSLGEIPYGLDSYLLIQLCTDSGLEGIAYCGYVFPTLIGALRATMRTMLDAAVGMDVWDTQRLVMVRNGLGLGSPAGLVARAASAVDMALWDLRGKATGEPVWRLLGAAGPRVASYASGHLWRHYSISELETSAHELAELGWRAMKLRCGAEPDDDREVERLAVVRRAVGPQVRIMIDVNQEWTVAQSIAMGRRFAPLDPFWLEDPLPAEDYSGYAAVTAALVTPICAGEYVYGLAPLCELVARRSVDILMIDGMRAGGITGFMKAAAVAEAHYTPVVSHLATEYLAHAIAACPNGLTAEHIPWTSPLFTAVPSLDPSDGALVLFDTPGFGLDFDEERIARYVVD